MIEVVTTNYFFIMIEIIIERVIVEMNIILLIMIFIVTILIIVIKTKYFIIIVLFTIKLNYLSFMFSPHSLFNHITSIVSCITIKCSNCSIEDQHTLISNLYRVAAIEFKLYITKNVDRHCNKSNKKIKMMHEWKS